MASLGERVKQIWLQNKWALCVMGIAWLIFFSPILIGGRVWFLDDLKDIYYPLEHVYSEFQSSWDLPLWSNEFGFGHPLIAWGQLGFFTPLHLVLRAFGIHPLILLQVSMATYFLIGVLSMYAFLRVRKFSPPASVLGAVVFTFNGFMVAHIVHVNFYTATMLLPVLLLAVHSFAKRPNWKRSIFLALAAAVIALSGQPQIVLLTFGIAALFGFVLTGHILRSHDQRLAYSRNLIGFTLLAGLLAATLASFAILPLLEFLPYTDRSADLPTSQLYEFSYPPSHSITLLFPDFFGGYNDYWGAKGFQELSAYVGVIPLLLASAALTFRKRFPVEQTAGILLVVTAIIFALGEYSVFYRFLVEQHLLTTLTVPGRFAYLFTVGIALLAAVGLENVKAAGDEKRRRIAILTAGLIIMIALSFPLYQAINENQLVAEQFLQAMSWTRQGPIILLASLVAWGAAVLCSRFNSRIQRLAQWTLTIIASSTLLLYGVGYIPQVDRTTALAHSPFGEALARYGEEQGIPARLYSQTQLLVSHPDERALHLTDAISPNFTVYQPVSPEEARDCLVIKAAVNENSRGTITAAFLTGVGEQPQAIQSIEAGSIRQHSNIRLCFPNDGQPTSDTDELLLAFTANTPSGIRLYYQPLAEGRSVYFVRVMSPTSDQLQQSQKQARLVYSTVSQDVHNLDQTLLTRHLQATAGASSARWIGALSIRSYREFIDAFFANDLEEVIDGDGLHAIERNRKLLDMGGVTHLAQYLPPRATDTMPAAGFEPQGEAPAADGLVRLYENPAAYPKAFVVPNAKFLAAADETRHAMMDPLFNPRDLVYVSGPSPPDIPAPVSEPLEASSTILKYSSTRIDIRVTTDREAFLIVTDSTVPQWRTYIDGKPSLYLVANSVFKAAQVPAGEHVVSFRYESPAVRWALWLTSISLIVTTISFLPRWPAARQASDTAGG